MKYIANFDQNGWLVEAKTINIADPIPEGFVEIPNKELFDYSNLKLENNTVRKATDQEISSRLYLLETNTLTITARNKRNNLLSDTDFYVLPDKFSTLSISKQTAITQYRQALRDITSQQSFPRNITWPDMPNMNNE
jgi:hypothetical protein